MADLIGRRYGKTNPWPRSRKSVVGSVAFWLSSSLVSVGLIKWMEVTGCMTVDVIDLIPKIAFITFVSAIFEVVSESFGDDNYTVPITAGLLSMLLLQ